MNTTLNLDRRNSLHAGDMSFQLVRFERTCDDHGVAVTTTYGEIICNNQDYYPHEVDPEFMRRIVACLNACQGMTTSDLEKQNALLGLGS
jgi:hypothetical protein